MRSLHLCPRLFGYFVAQIVCPEQQWYSPKYQQWYSPKYQQFIRLLPFVCYYYLYWWRHSFHRLQGLWWLIECMHICTQSTPSVSALKCVRWSYPTNSLIPLSLLFHHEPLVPWLVPCKKLLYVVTGHKVLFNESHIHFIYNSKPKM